MLESHLNNAEQQKPLPPGRLDQPFAEYFKENGIEIPPVELTLLFSRHWNESDATWIEPYYKETDVFIPERVNWLEKSLELFRHIAEGNNKPPVVDEDFIKQRINGGFQQELVRIVKRNPGKKITFVDLKAGTELSDKSRAAMDRMSAEIKATTNSGFHFTRAAEANKAAVEKFAVADDEREKSMLQSIPLRLAELVKDNPELAKKEKIKVLLQLGAAHTRIYHHLKNRGENVSRAFDHTPLHYTESTSLLSRAKAFNKPVNDEASQRIFFADTISKFTFLWETSDILSAEKSEVYLKSILDAFSLQEMASLFKKIKPNVLAFQKNFERMLQEKGIPIIKTKDDAEKAAEWFNRKV